MVGPKSKCQASGISQIGDLSSELSAFEHNKIWCIQTLCCLSDEQSLPIGLLFLKDESSLFAYRIFYLNLNKIF